MRKVLLAAGVLAAVGVVVSGMLLAFIQLTWDKQWPDTPYPDLRVSSDPDVIAHGRYLVTGPAHCSNCHVGSVEEFERADAGEQLPLRGGWVFEMGPLGAIATKNLTPDPETGIGRFSDAEIFRMMRHNVRPNHRASLAPMMPFQQMADDDLVAAVSYLRSLEPVRHEVPPNRWAFVARALFAFGPPAPFSPVVGHAWPKTAPTIAPTVERGEYLANSVANCRACHTPIDPMTGEETGPAFSGAAAPEPSLKDAGVMLMAPNLTPHPTGVLDDFATAAAWVARFRAGRTVPESYMHWGPFSRMEEDDLVAIYTFLKTVEPVDRAIPLTVIR